MFLDEFFLSLFLCIFVPIIIGIAFKALKNVFWVIFQPSFNIREYKRLIELYLAYFIFVLLTEVFKSTIANAFALSLPQKGISTFSLFPLILYFTLRTSTSLFPSIASDFFSSLLILISVALSSIIIFHVLRIETFSIEYLPSSEIFIFILAGIPLVFLEDLILEPINKFLNIRGNRKSELSG